MRILAGPDPFLDHGGLQIEVLPRSDSRPYQTGQDYRIVGIEWGNLHKRTDGRHISDQVRRQKMQEGDQPVWFSQHSGDDIRKVDQADGEKDSLYPFR